MKRLWMLIVMVATALLLALPAVAEGVDIVLGRGG